MSDATKKNGMATAALVLGIVSIALFFMPYIAIICGIVAVVLAISAKKKIKADPDLAHTSGSATGGLVMGIIGTVISAILLVLAMMLVSEMNDRADNWQDLIDDMEQYD